MVHINMDLASQIQILDETFLLHTKALVRGMNPFFLPLASSNSRVDRALLPCK